MTSLSPEGKIMCAIPGSGNSSSFGNGQNHESAGFSLLPLWAWSQRGPAPAAGRSPPCGASWRLWVAVPPTLVALSSCQGWRKPLQKMLPPPLINGIRRPCLSPGIPKHFSAVPPFQGLSFWVGLGSLGAFLPGSSLQVQTHPSVLGMWGDKEFCLKGKEMGPLPWTPCVFPLVSFC